MEVCLSDRLGIPYTRVNGVLDRAHARYVLEVLTAGVRLREGRPLLLDMSGVTCIDSGGFSALMQVVRALEGEGWIAAVVPPGHVRRMVELVGLPIKSEFRVFDSLPEALSAIDDEAGMRRA